jgi:hypothetical protein
MSDWRTGHIIHVRNENRDAATFCRLVEKRLKQSARRNLRVILMTDRA